MRSREKKKQQVDSLEDVIARLNAEKEELQRQNAHWKEMYE